MITNEFKRTKRACHFSYLSMSSVFCLPPMLFLTFHEAYGVSYTLLGTLVLVNFCTQLIVDLIFSFFSKHFNIKKTVRIMPLITSLGLLVYALAPNIFGQRVYIGLALGTVIFSVASGLSEVLLSPIVAAIPGSTPKDMSMLHSLYAVGVVTVVGLSSAFLKVFGNENWQILALLWAAAPVVACVLFCCAPFPDMDAGHGQGETGGKKAVSQKFGIALCVACIFLGSAAENTMTNWISTYMESALGIPKSVGDILGMAVFAALLGLGRVIYAKRGRNILRLLTVSMAGAAVCYMVAGISANVIIAFAACILTGLCVSMLWPGSLILMEEKVSGVGVAAYALMAAGGDFGASVAPQLLGAVVDRANASQTVINIAAQMSLSAEQVGIKLGMLMAAAFPIVGVALLIYMNRYFKKSEDK